MIKRIEEEKGRKRRRGERKEEGERERKREEGGKERGEDRKIFYNKNISIELSQIIVLS